jgi:hypothetical protein
VPLPGGFASRVLPALQASLTATRAAPLVAAGGRLACCVRAIALSASAAKSEGPRR